VALFLLSLVHYWHERHLLEEQIHLAGLQSGETMLSSLRQAMLLNDREMLAQTLADWSKVESVQRAWIIDHDGRVKVDSHGEGIGSIQRRDAPGCIECHRFPAAARPRTVRSPTTDAMLRIAMPVVNEPDCLSCHEQAGRLLGLLLVDVPLVTPEQDLLNHLRIEALIVTGTILLVSLALHLLISLFVVRRVNALRRPLVSVAAGDFALRLPVSSGPADELDELANAFNYMAEELERFIGQQERLNELRQRAIVEERERIARELHDGMAQILGYVNTKVMAARLMLKSHQMEAANTNLLQIEESTRDLYLDMREAILGLKMAGQIGAGLCATLLDFIAQFQRLSGLLVEIVFSPDVKDLPLAGEIELQLLRIVQEALTNVRKHASTNKAWVSLQTDGQFLELTVGDAGKGFDPQHVWRERQPHFGLSIMRERAEAIGAEFALHSQPGSGTRVVIKLTVEEGETDAYIGGRRSRLVS